MHRDGDPGTKRTRRTRSGTASLTLVPGTGRDARLPRGAGSRPATSRYWYWDFYLDLLSVWDEFVGDEVPEELQPHLHVARILGYAKGDSSACS